MINKFLILLFLVSASLFAETDRSKLLENLEKINELHRKISKEKAEWREEKKTLELQLQLIKDSFKEQTENKYEQEKALGELKKKKDSLVKKSDSIVKSLNQLKIVVTASSSSMLKKIKPVMPESLSILVKEETDELDKLLSEKDVNVMDLLSASREYFSAVLEMQKNVHLTKEVVSLNGEKQQVTALYIGTYIGYFLSKDKSSAGLLVFDGQWQVQERNDLVQSIQKAISQYNREGKPVLVSLPVPGGNRK